MNVILNNKEIPVEIMDTPNSISTGMMGRDHLEGGMLFVFEDVGERSFWMKNCLIPLDIIFMVRGEVSEVYENCPPCMSEPCDHYWGLADKVLELNGGTYKNFNI
eukprot:SAG11_NODE_62_length_19006_cov_6.513143_15_plen_105_part_00